VEHARPATLEDLDVVVALWDMGVAELDGQRGGDLLAGSLVRSDLAGSLRAALSDPDRLITLGFLESVPIGLASTYCDRDRRELVGVVELIYVEPGARQVGVAEAMLGVVMPWCDAQGCVGVDAPALPGSRPAKAFFEDNGFLARLIVMHRSLPGAGPSEGGRRG
jgi:GNAT superfamily N-acetyltransferase